MLSESKGNLHSKAASVAANDAAAKLCLEAVRLLNAGLDPTTVLNQTDILLGIASALNSRNHFSPNTSSLKITHIPSDADLDLLK